jgi:hypothetical protein
MDLADVVRRHGPAYLRRHGDAMPPSHRRALEDILRCHTAAAGGSLYRCGPCGEERFAYHRCGNRACGRCGHPQAQAWLERQQEQLLAGVPYFLVTFTVPEELRPLFRQHQRLLYGLLLRESAATLQEIAAKPRHFGGSLAMLGVLHTWTRQLVYHPHVHYVVPGVALAPDGTLAFGASPEFFLPVQVLSARFRSRMRQALQALAPELLARVPGKTWRKGWVVHSQPAGSGEKALQYLSRYVFKTAISSARLLWQDDERVAFSWRDSATREERTCVLAADEFLRRFLQHVLPRRFRRVRTYGWLSPAAKLRKSQVHALLGTDRSPQNQPGRESHASPARRHRPVQFLCPHCSRPMARIGELGRAPPRSSCLSS